ncbi:uncharacterized protein LOC143538757 [Bidens hawaiensis]|uniref:uncharacterized protein LOC143538757 n=1 Tax=Bidens hawaiensis TaxID=980011 RepID=UPI00404B9830
MVTQSKSDSKFGTAVVHGGGGLIPATAETRRRQVLWRTATEQSQNNNRTATQQRIPAEAPEIWFAGKTGSPEKNQVAGKPRFKISTTPELIWSCGGSCGDRRTIVVAVFDVRRPEWSRRKTGSPEFVAGFLMAARVCCHIPGALCQDPRFVGGDGLTFYFHGHKDQDFCLLSDHNLHINGHFIGKRNPKLTRDFTWVQSTGILFNDHKLLVGAKKTSTWNDNEEHLFISYDDTPLSLDGKDWNYRNASLMITRTSPTNGIAIEVQNSFRITATVVPIGAEESRIHGYDITKDDCFAHLDLRFKFYSLSDVVDGVLGQTYRRDYVSKIKVSATMPVMGIIPKYSTSGIFTTDCAVSRFDRLNVAPEMVSGEVF